MTETTFEVESRYDIKMREKLLVNWAWFKFHQVYPDEKTSIEKLFRYFSELGRVICHHCNSSAVERTDIRNIRCRDCRKSSWFTAGTFFDHAKKLRACLGAIWLWESGVNCSTNYFAKLANIATSTASALVKKIAMIINERMSVAGVALTSKEFMRLFLRRSCMTPAKEHPSFEQHAFEEEQRKLRVKASAKDSAESSSSSAQTTQVHLSHNDLKLCRVLSDEPQDFEQLLERSELKTNELTSALVKLEMYHYVKPMPGETYVRLTPERSESALNHKYPKGFDRQEIRQSICAYLKLTKHGISRKNFQLYSAKYWTTADRVTWGHGKILALCIESEPIQPAALKSFVTPLIVYVSPVVADRLFEVAKKRET